MTDSVDPVLSRAVSLVSRAATLLQKRAEMLVALGRPIDDDAIVALFDAVRALRDLGPEDGPLSDVLLRDPLFSAVYHLGVAEGERRAEERYREDALSRDE